MNKKQQILAHLEKVGGATYKDLYKVFSSGDPKSSLGGAVRNAIWVMKNNEGYVDSSETGDGVMWTITQAGRIYLREGKKNNDGAPRKAPRRKSTHQSSTQEQVFRGLIVEIGRERAQALLEDTILKLQQLVAGVS